MKVLLVDDAMLSRTILRNILGAAGGHDFWEASTGEEGIALYGEVRPDLVMMDINMPGMGGISAIKEIISLDRDARIIACSALGEKTVVTEALRAGAREFIMKPFESGKVCQIVSSVCAN